MKRTVLITGGAGFIGSHLCELFLGKGYKVICVDKEKLAGNNILAFKCQSVINGDDKLFEIKYELGTCRWILFKI